MGKVIMSEEGFLSYNQLRNSYTQADNIIVDRKCVGYQFTNLGDVIAFVNGMIIYPGVPGTSLGDSRTILLFERSLYKGNIELSFQVPTAGTAPNVEIVQFVYMQE